MNPNELSLTNANALASLFSQNMNSGNIYGQDHVHRVSGIEGMNTFQTKPSSDYALFEEDSDIFCFKVTDASNSPSYRYFAFKEITKEEALQEISPFLMKGELESFKEDMLSAIRAEMSNFKEDILNGQQSIRKQSGYTGASKAIPTAGSANG